MTRDLCAVFARIGVGGSEEGNHHFVDDLCAILDMAVVNGIGFCL